jgi:hypothetical protein
LTVKFPGAIVLDETADKAAGLERRRSPRLYAELPIEFSVFLPEQQRHLSSRATLLNISKVGAYLECQQSPALILGQVGHFTFRGVSAGAEAGSTRLAARGVIRRFERLGAGPLPFGVGVEFLAGPLVAYP